MDDQHILRGQGSVVLVLDWAFGAQVSDVVFGDSFSFTSFEGETLLEQFLDGIMPLIAESFQTELNSASKRDKYLNKYKK